MAVYNSGIAPGLELLNDNIAGVYSIQPDRVSRSSIKRGLRNADGTGVLIGMTDIGSVQGYTVIDSEKVPMEGRLYYRGISSSDIAEANLAQNTFGFEEVIYLLLMGKLPNAEEFTRFKDIITEARKLPTGFNEDVIFKAPSGNIMNQLSRSILGLYAYDPCPDDTSPENMLRQSVEIVARIPSIVANCYAVMRHYIMNKSLYIHNARDELSQAENFLRMARPDKSYTEEEAHLLDMMLMLHAEHGGGNNSTFTCRAVSSTGTDTYSAIAAAVGSLKGPLHGGANAKVMEMFGHIKAEVSDYHDDEEIEAYLKRLLDGEVGDLSGKLYGLGHAVYTLSDPRAVMIRKYARSLADEKGRLRELELMENVERIGGRLLMERKGMATPVCANVDMYSGFVYSMLGIPTELYTPLFAIARSAGWCAHRMEEVLSTPRIMRPAYKAVHRGESYIPMAERK
ncbi:MAG: citrate synthase [Oscillospiraceae bacterium]|nr:citrate synthase [Oscillospiraceae bacterium]